ncbi:helix-turn-helix domain-containing protein [Mycolicibacterium mageritense]|jgi:hypothetical protein|uniref:helix-turn-helix domain-containing protein n=1 Tax=Mycolicibacterium mageritense TaxID=53462 RepID=UPI001E2AD90A|nr:hypothetical protein [Mycolicibacterium mageritense]MCC9184377.1 hypothetical protein [Mycolicibacterium mageritense]
MVQNSPWFAAYMRETREKLGWTQQQVHDAGGAYRQLQASVENGDADTVRDDVLHGYERAYGWPHGYATALAELGAHAHDPQPSDALAAGERDAAAAQGYIGREDPNIRWKTFTGLYDRDGGPFPYLGFDADTGDPVDLAGPALSTVTLNVLHPMILARHGHITIDVNVLDRETAGSLVSEYAGGTAYGGAAAQKIALYRTGTHQPIDAEPIGIDPLAELTSLRAARALAAALLSVRPEIPTTELRAGFTYAAITAFGGDRLCTLTELRTGHHRPASDGTFLDFWTAMYRPEHAGWALAQPDRAAADLLGGVIDARDRLLDFDVDARADRSVVPSYTSVRTVPPREFLDFPDDSSFLFYDSHVSPELPAALYSNWKHAGLLFYEVTVETSPNPSHPPAVPGPATPTFSIGITAADDRDVVRRHRYNGFGTITNLCGRQAIYCEGGRARRIWIPEL